MLHVMYHCLNALACVVSGQDYSFCECFHVSFKHVFFSRTFLSNKVNLIHGNVVMSIVQCNRVTETLVHILINGL